MLKDKLRLSIRWKFILPFVVIIVLVVVVIVPAISSGVTARIEEAADERLHDTVNSVRAMLERSAEQAELSASFVANLSEVKESNAEVDRLGEILPARRDSLGLQELSFYGADYRPGSTPVYYGGPVVSRRFQVSESAQDARDILILEVLTSGEAGQTIAIAPQGSQIMGAAPVHDSEGNVQGVIIAAFFLNDSYIEEISNVLGAEVAIIKDNATIVSTIDQSTGYDSLLLEGTIDPNGENHAINLETSMEDGTESQRLLANPLILYDQPNGILLVAQSINEFTAVEQLIRQGAWLISGLLILMSSLFGVFSYLNFARPITDLAAAARRVQIGDFTQRIESHPFIRDEISELSEDFNAMTEWLESLVIDLEKQVSERTEELVKERNKLEIMSHDLAEARDEALEANRTKSAFLANMSHELRTPLNSILGYSELLIQGLYGEMEEKQRDRLQTVVRNGKHLLELINDILDLSKIEAGRMELRMEPTALHELVETTTGSIEPMIKARGLELKISVPETLPLVEVDKSRMTQVLINLMSNAVKFTPEGSVTIFSEVVTSQAQIPGDKVHLNGKEGPWLLLGVDDTGIGIAREDHGKIFDEFQQADNTSTREYEGTGLGLAISRRLVMMMNGEIWLESAPGEGTTFYILLPVKLDDVTV